MSNECIKFQGSYVCESNRKALYSIFTKFGEIERLFICRTGDFGYLYFKGISEYAETVNKIRELNLPNVKFYVHSSSFVANTSNGSEHSCEENKSEMANDDIYASENEFLYCIHGHAIPRLIDDNDVSYVPLKKLKCMNVKLFDNPPSQNDKLDYNIELMKEFEAFMKQKALSFMQRNKVRLEEFVILKSINECKDLAFKKAGDSPLQQNNVTTNHQGHTRKFNPHKTPTLNNSANNYHSQKFSASNSSTPKPFSNHTPVQKPLLNNTPIQKPLLNNTPNQKPILKNAPVQNPLNDSPIPRTSSNENSIGANVSITKKIQDLNKSVVEPLKYIELDEGDTHEMLVTHVEDDGFYVQLQEKQQAIEDLLFRTMRESGTATPTKPVTGKIYFCLYTGAWYRAVVLTTQPALKVRYIDYGNPNVEAIKEVREMAAGLASVPAQAVKVQFNEPTNIVPKDEMNIKLKIIKKKANGLYAVSTVDESSKPKLVTPSASNVDTPLRLPREIKTESRKCIIDIPERSALLSVIDFVNATSFIGFLYHENCVNEISILDDITTESTADPNYKPTPGTTIAVKRESQEWVRGIVLSTTNNKYKCALIDFGVILETDQICKLNSKYENIVEFAFLVEVKEEFIPTIKQVKDNIQCEILKDRKLIFNIHEKQIPALGSKWNPQSIKTIITTLPSEIQMKNGDLVRIYHLDGEKLYVQTKESFGVLKAMNDQLNSFKGNNLSVKPVKKQLVLHKCKGKPVLCRALVENVNNDQVDLYYIDYGVNDTVPLKEIYEYEEDYQKFDCTLSILDLNNFISGKCTKDVINEIEKIKHGNKFTVIINESTGKIDLKFLNTEELLSDHLNQLIEKSNIKTMKDIVKNDIKKGFYKLICLHNSNMDQGLVAFCAPNIIASTVNELSEDIAKHTANPHAPYKPQLNEICLALFDDVWYRAVVKKVLSTNYDVYFFDYGNCKILNSSEIRPITKELLNVPPVAILCEIDGLKEQIKKNEDIIEVMQQMCAESTLVNVEVLDKTVDDTYVIKINDSLNEF